MTKIETANLLNGERDFCPIVRSDKEYYSMENSIVNLFERYQLWDLEELASAVDHLDKCYSDRVRYLTYDHEGIWKRMKQHRDIKPPSYGEKLVTRCLEERGLDYKAECYLGTKETVIQSIRFDFAIWEDGKLYAVEYNGRQHYEACEKFGGQKVFETQQKKDGYKRIFCKENDIPLLEIPYTVCQEEDPLRSIGQMLDSFLMCGSKD